MASFTSSVPVPTVDETGCHIPAFEDIYAALQAEYRGVYGSDVVLDPDTQDGQWLGIQAAALNDYCAAFLAVYNAFSPSTAKGTGLSSVVKVNGIARSVATLSTVDVVIIGQVGTEIINGIVTDDVNQWLLPASVVIPVSGQIQVTAKAPTVGAIMANAGTVTGIFNPTRGWQSVSNPEPAVPGKPVETDPQLRLRQTASVALPSLTALDGIVGAVEDVYGVTRVKAFENDTNLTDGNGIPGHAIALVIEGGDAQAIANAIGLKKTPGAGTYGDTVETYTNVAGVPRDIRFFRPGIVPIRWAITLRALNGYTASIQNAIKVALAAWTSALDIGKDVRITRAYVPANLGGGLGSASFEILTLKAARDSNTPSVNDIVIAFNEAATSSIDLIAITVVT